MAEVIPGGFIAAIDWLCGTRRSWKRLPKGGARRTGYLAVAMRLAELGGGQTEQQARRIAEDHVRFLVEERGLEYLVNRSIRIWPGRDGWGCRGWTVGVDADQEDPDYPDTFTFYIDGRGAVS